MSSARSFNSERFTCRSVAQRAIVVSSTSQGGDSKQLVVALFSGPLCLIRYRAVLSLSDDTGGTMDVKNIKCLKARELHKEHRLRLPELVTVARFWFSPPLWPWGEADLGSQCTVQFVYLLAKVTHAPPCPAHKSPQYCSTLALANRCYPTTSFWLARPAVIDSR